MRAGGGGLAKPASSASPGAPKTEAARANALSESRNERGAILRPHGDAEDPGHGLAVDLASARLGHAARVQHRFVAAEHAVELGRRLVGPEDQLLEGVDGVRRAVRGGALPPE